MKSASGMVYSNGRFAEGSVSVSKGRLAVSSRQNDDADVKGIILPRTVNCHTHLGDAFIGKPGKCTVEELVAPPDGYKHRMLRKVTEEVQVNAMMEAISTISMSGTSHFIDFRESGLEGARRLLMASLGSGAIPIILGRPDSDDVDEVSALLNVCDGIGFSAVSDMDYGSLERISDQTRAQEKILALHASEAHREDFEQILNLKPDLLVHMVESSPEDLDACATAMVPVAICPTSNSFFGLVPPVREMLDAGISVCLGTDNAMLAAPSMLDEIRCLRAMFGESVLSDLEIMNICFAEGRKVLNSLPGLGDAYLEHRDFFVLESPLDDPFKSVLGARTENVRLFDRSETA